MLTAARRWRQPDSQAETGPRIFNFGIFPASAWTPPGRFILINYMEVDTPALSAAHSSGALDPAICDEWVTKGYCPKRRKQRCEKRHDKALRGQLGDERELCVHWTTKGVCAFSDDDCNFKHDEHKRGPLQSAFSDEESSQSQRSSLQPVFCCVCLDRRAECLLLPCAHLCCCSRCLRGLKKKCPVCRSVFKKCEQLALINNVN